MGTFGGVKGWEAEMRYIADVLTALRFVCAAGLIVLSCTVCAGAPVWLAFWVYFLGLMTDAFDGMAARRWPYPESEKHWWRDYAVELDQAADLLLGFAALVYVMARIDFGIGLWILLVSVVIALPIQAWRTYRISKFGPDGAKDPLRRKVILVRRYLYLTAIVVVGLILLSSSEYILDVKVALLIAGVFVGVALVYAKMDRLTQDKTPTPTAEEKETQDE